MTNNRNNNMIQYNIRPTLKQALTRKKKSNINNNVIIKETIIKKTAENPSDVTENPRFEAFPA